jgi:hypothetical protein
MLSLPEVPDMAEQDVDSDYPDRGGPVEEKPSEQGKKEATIDREHKVPPAEEEQRDEER